MTTSGRATATAIDLYSDTVTVPTEGMRACMASAEVGDEQKGEDPSVNELLELVCDRLGHEAAVFLPSGTMCNEIAYAVHCRPGDEIILDATAHPLHFEAGGPAVLAGAMVRPLQGRRGVFTAEQLEQALRPDSRYAPVSRLVSVEQTSNLGGGTCWTPDQVRDVVDSAHRAGLAAHLDGARLFNAVARTGTSARDFASRFDSAWIDLTKGLGAPVGAVLAGSVEFVAAAWRHKQRLGGAMRQAGILAAAGTYALHHHTERLHEDHEHARRLAERLAELPSIELDPDHVETNIVLFRLRHPLGAKEFADRLLEEHGVRLSVMGEETLRAVTHLGVSGSQIEVAARAIRAVL